MWNVVHGGASCNRYSRSASDGFHVKEKKSRALALVHPPTAGKFTPWAALLRWRNLT